MGNLAPCWVGEEATGKQGDPWLIGVKGDYTRHLTFVVPYSLNDARWGYQTTHLIATGTEEKHNNCGLWAKRQMGKSIREVFWKDLLARGQQQLDRNGFNVQSWELAKAMQRSRRSRGLFYFSNLLETTIAQLFRKNPIPKTRRVPHKNPAVLRGTFHGELTWSPDTWYGAEKWRVVMQFSENLAWAVGAGG